MTSQPITDIETLLHQVRDLNSQNLIKDAISAYHGGALRSAVISTWNAVVNDIIVKARELHNHGESTYKSFIDSLDNAIENDNIQKKTKIERDILNTAKDNFQIITPHEYELLDRLKSDRNVCAHPSLVEDDQLFEPTPDLVRTHIVHALTILLIQAPLQGKSALSRFRSELLNDSFPTTENEVRKFVFLKYLIRSKDGFIENLVKLMIKSIFFEIDPDLANKKRKLSWIMAEVYMRKPSIFKKIVQNFFSQQFGVAEDRIVLGVFTLLGAEPTIWEWIDKPNQMKVIGLIENCAYNDLEKSHAFDAYNVPGLKPVLYKRLQNLNNVNRYRIISDYLHEDFISIALEVYSRSGSFRGAEAIGWNIIVPLSSKFKKDDVIRFIDAVLENSQVYDAVGTPEVVEKVFEETATHRSSTKSRWKDFFTKMIENCNYNSQAISAFKIMELALEDSPTSTSDEDFPF